MISVKMLDAQGKSLERDSVFSIYYTDMKHIPFTRRVEFKASGEIIMDCQEYPVMFNATITIPGYGRTWVIIDNCGQGYKDGAQIDFIREAAMSRAWLVERELKKGGFIPSPKCLSLINDAKTLIGLAENSHRIHEFYMTDLGAGMWAGELLVAERARARIAAAAKKENFLFGCGAFGYPYEHIPGVREKFDSLFNFSTLPFYLAGVESERGKPQFDKLDKLYDEFTKSNIVTKGHPLWWGFAFPNSGTPDWAMNYNWDEVREAVEYICKTRAQRFKGRVDMFDVINEAHDWANSYNLTQEQEIEVTKIACDSTHEANPDAVAVINICQPYAEYAGQGRILYGPVYERCMSPYSYFERIRDRGIDYEVVGIQLYNPARDMLSIEMMLDRFAEFGKPIHITELGVASYKTDMPYNWSDEALGGLMQGLWHEFEWNERLQADWLEDFYTLCYAHPKIDAVTWWNVTDPAFCPAGGMIEEDGTPKEICFRLKALEQAWGFDFGKK